MSSNERKGNPMSDKDTRKSEKGADEEWKRRVNKLGDAYFKACKRIASALSRLSRDRDPNR